MKWILIFCIVLVSSASGASVNSGRIIGGEAATSNQYPFAAAVHVQTSNSKFFCGGTLYRHQWIITAGQCVNGATLFTIYLGSTKLEEEDENREIVATSDYVLHPDYNPETLENDIALIKLRLRISYTITIRPVDMLSRDAQAATPETELRSIGWGQTTDHNSSLSDHLNTVFVSALTNDECKLTYGNQIKDSMICVIGNYNEGACHGDTGAPLVEMYQRRMTMIHGVSSFISGNGCESTDPSGYTRIHPYAEWIENLVSTA